MRTPVKKARTRPRAAPARAGDILLAAPNRVKTRPAAALCPSGPAGIIPEPARTFRGLSVERYRASARFQPFPAVASPIDLSRIHKFELPGPDNSLSGRLGRRAQSVRLRNVVISWPFAALSACLADYGLPTWRQWALLLGAIMAARAFIVVLSRAVADESELEENPGGWRRIVDWAGPWVVTFSLGVMTLTACGFLHLWALAWAPAGLAVLVGCWWAQGRGAYTHAAEGISAAAAPLLGWLGMRGSLLQPDDWPAWALALAAALWAAGMDILVAVRREEADREADFQTLAVRYGRTEAARAAWACHAMMLAPLALLSAYDPLDGLYLTGAAGFVLLTAYAHALAQPERGDKMDAQFFLFSAAAMLWLIGPTIADIFVA